MGKIKFCDKLENIPCIDLFGEPISPYITSRNIVWIYFLCDGDTVRYIGKTNNLKTRISKHRHPKTKTYRDNWIRKMIKENRKISIAFIEKCSTQEWEEREKYWIKFGREQNWPLTNLTDGGEGVIGRKYVMSEAQKRAISAAKKGKVVISDEQKEILRQKNLGKKLSDKTKALISAACKGNKGPRGNKWWVGRKHSEETKKKMSESAKNRPRRPHTPESKEKIRQAALKRYSKKP